MSRVQPELFQRFTLPPACRDRLERDGDWLVERLRYVVRPRPKPKFHGVLDARRILAPEGGETTVVTRLRPDPRPGDEAIAVEVRHGLLPGTIIERATCTLSDDGRLRAGDFLRRFVTPDGVETRRERADLTAPIGPIPDATYPEVVTPFLMRGQPRAARTPKRSLYAWTNDRFISKVYTEVRGERQLSVPAGRFRCFEQWMYPDLNDWVALGGVLTKLAKPFIPRYTTWYEADAPWRVVRFEGAYGPPGAPEVILELAEP
ncbi:MAG: hypothetical protein CSA66_02775 [Proteobacteria bacterium]|nr:MAG: hypothetical protein CSA66_02775 [Pseudomonadota bacterium]